MESLLIAIISPVFWSILGVWISSRLIRDVKWQGRAAFGLNVILVPAAIFVWVLFEMARFFSPDASPGTSGAAGMALIGILFLVIISATVAAFVTLAVRRRFLGHPDEGDKE